MLDPPPSTTLLDVGAEVGGPARPGQPSSPLLADVALDTIHVNRTRQLSYRLGRSIVETPDTAADRRRTAGQRVAVLGFDLHQSDLPLQPGVRC